MYMLKIQQRSIEIASLGKECKIEIEPGNCFKKDTNVLILSQGTPPPCQSHPYSKQPGSERLAAGGMPCSPYNGQRTGLQSNRIIISLHV